MRALEIYYIPQEKKRIYVLKNNSNLYRLILIIGSLCEPIDYYWVTKYGIHYKKISNSRHKIKLISTIEQRFKILIKEINTTDN